MKDLLAKPGRRVTLADWDPDSTPGISQEEAEVESPSLLGALAKWQERLYAESKQTLLIVLQGIDTSGKDGTIRHVMKGANPQSCRVSSFKAPSTLERSHDFLWRIHQEVPPKGFIGIFNRSHYEDVIVTRVHGLVSHKEAKKRFKRINEFEHLLTQNGTTILKFFLHISKDEQKQRLQARLDDPEKRWKFSVNDLAERKFWKDYQRMFEDALSATSTRRAPWYVIPANHKWYRDWAVGHVVVKTLQAMNPTFPPLDPRINPAKIRIR